MKDGENAPWKIFLFMCKHLKVSYNAFVYLKAQRAERNQYFFYLSTHYTETSPPRNNL